MILDTNAVSALSFEDEDLVTLLDSSAHHHLPVIVIGEYEFGLAGSKRRKELTAWLSLLISKSVVLGTDRETASHYAAICAALKRAGTPIPVNDIWIAALARQHGLSIVSRDKHFANVPGIQLVGW